jgi:hypothetical protein
MKGVLPNNDKASNGLGGQRFGCASRMRRPLLLWLALIGFILGVSLCPFSPVDSKEEQFQSTQSTKERRTMTTSANSTVNTTDAGPIKGGAQAGLETATFAMG